MTRSYLILEKGPNTKRRYPITKQLSIGRRPDNDVQLVDPSVSRKHAVVYSMGGYFFVEDIGSQNGTFLNGIRIRKATLASGDEIRFGNVTLHFIQDTKEEPVDAEAMDGEFEETYISIMDTDRQLHAHTGLLQTLSKIPLFSHLNWDEIKFLGKMARFVVYDRGIEIIRKGQKAHSLYIILSGKVLMKTGPEGSAREFLLSESDYFGPLSSRLQTTYTATVRTLEETLLCELPRDAIQVILDRRELVEGQ
jgi:hypothetical protein